MSERITPTQWRQIREHADHQEARITILKAKVEHHKARAEAAEAANQRVRDWLDNAGFPIDTESPYGCGYSDAMADARRVLDGDA